MEAKVLDAIRRGLDKTAARRELGLSRTEATSLWMEEIADRHDLLWYRSRHTSRHYEQILVKDSPADRAVVKRAAIESGLVDADECAECGIPPEWNGKPLVFHLDHINGDARDHRPENLRFLCPNCHSQTDTYCRAIPLRGTPDQTPATGAAVS